MKAITDFLDKYQKISKESYNEFSKIFERKTYPKNHVFYKPGCIHKKFYILESGVARSLIEDANGNLHIRTLFTEVSAVGSLPSLIDQKPSSSEYSCITKCIVLEADFSKLMSLVKKNHDISLLYSKFLERVFSRIEDRNTDLATLNSEERYLKLKRLAPNIENLIPLYHIAAYLSITPIQLSRIRKKIYSK